MSKLEKEIKELLSVCSYKVIDGGVSVQTYDGIELAVKIKALVLKHKIK